jgi:catechol 2,3-dioxygenase-like lactoylglutathione lyase family enzyme
MKLYHNLFCRDIEAQLRFYQALLALPEAVHSRSPIYRAVEASGFQFGFHASPAYGLLQLDNRTPTCDTPPTTGYPTFMLDTPAQVDAAAQRAETLGATRVKGPYPTYYGQWQVVLTDPEGHVFRLSTDGLPEGVCAPTLAACPGTPNST